MIPAPAQRVLDYWLGEATRDPAAAETQASLWWRKSPETDAEIRARFGEAVAAASRGELDYWAETAGGRLAVIVLLDQFRRNIHRDTPAAFAEDARALAHCEAAIAAGQDRELRPVERAFLYMPLEHAESVDAQRRSVEAFRQLLAESPAQWQTVCESFLDFAQRHAVIIERFGRFPHRNAILGRESSEAERAFLREPGSSF